MKMKDEIENIEKQTKTISIINEDIKKMLEDMEV